MGSSRKYGMYRTSVFYSLVAITILLALAARLLTLDMMGSAEMRGSIWGIIFAGNGHVALFVICFCIMLIAVRWLAEIYVYVESRLRKRDD